MRHWALVLALAVVPALTFAQVAVTSSGWATTAGPAVATPQANVPLVTTPELHLGTYSPSPVGATNATANNVAGATNSTIGNVAPVANSTGSQAQFTSPYPSVVGAGGEYATVPATALTATPSGVSTAQPYFDRGAAQFVSAYDIGAPQPVGSLGEMARQWRQQRQAQNARTYTNEDINRLEQQYGPPAGGASATAVNAGTSTSGENAPTAPPPQPNLGTNTAPAAPSSPFTPPAGTQQSTVPPQSSAPPPQQQARVEYPATMQSSGAAQQPAQPQSGVRAGLPGTASNLPTLLLLGASAALVGLLLRRRNQRRSGVGF